MCWISGNPPILLQSDSAASFSDGLALVGKDGKMMYIDNGGVMVREER